MNDTMNNWNVQLIGMLGIAALGFIAILHFGRDRSDTLNVMSGVGDERTRSLYTRAVAFVGSVMAFVLPGWWLVTVAQGDPDRTLTILCAIFGVTFIGAVAVPARRS
jgi:hypothetical protein